MRWLTWELLYDGGEKPNLVWWVANVESKLYNKIFSKEVEPQSKNGLCSIVVESFLHVTTTHKTRKSRCHMNIQPQDANTFKRLQVYAFKGDWTPIHIRLYPIAIEGDL
jgi:hypothetical protein